MSTNVHSIPGKCKVNISIDCPCKLSVQGREYDAVPGDFISIEQANPLIPAAFFIQIKEVSSLIVRLVSLRRAIAGRLDANRKLSRSSGYTYERGYMSCCRYSLSEFVGMLDDILKDYSL